MNSMSGRRSPSVTPTARRSIVAMRTAGFARTGPAANPLTAHRPVMAWRIAPIMVG